MARLPTRSEITDIQSARPGTKFNADELDEAFLRRMKQSGYFDASNRRTSGVERLRFQYQTDGLALFLGAGVSKASGIPDWRGLIDGVLRTLDIGAAFPNQQSVSRLLEEKAGLSLLSQFEFISQQCTRQGKSFIDVLRDQLYGAPRFEELRGLMNEIPFKNDEKLRFNWGPLIDELKKKATLAAVGDLVLRPDGHHLYAINQNIGAIVTTNADNLLQTYVMGRCGGKRLLTTVDRASVGDHPGRISVYHLHGWIDPRDHRIRKAVMPSLVFRESEYFGTIANQNSFANYTAQSLLQRRNVLFIGTSMEDINVRRWLHNSFQERRRHRSQFLRQRYGDYDGLEAEAFVASIRHFWFKRVKDLPEPTTVIQEAVSETMKKLGVEVVWYNEHEEIAEHLRSLSISSRDHPTI